MHDNEIKTTTTRHWIRSGGGEGIIPIRHLDVCMATLDNTYSSRWTHQLLTVSVFVHLYVVQIFRVCFYVLDFFLSLSYPIDSFIFANTTQGMRLPWVLIFASCCNNKYNLCNCNDAYMIIFFHISNIQNIFMWTDLIPSAAIHLDVNRTCQT